MNLLSTTFLAPIAFLGFLGIAVPLYLHLRHKPRATPLKFAAFEFLLRARRKQKRKLRVEQWLLMALRVAVLALLAVIFAQPFRDELFQASSSLSKRPYVVVLDNSLSMLAGKPQTYFDEAKDTLSDHLAQRERAAPTAVLLASQPESPLAALTASELAGLVPSLKVDTRRITLDAAYQKALSLLNEQGWENATIQIFSDGNRSAWVDLPSAPPDGVEVIYSSMRAQRSPLNNVGIVAVTQPRGFDRGEIDVRLRNGSEQGTEFEIRVQSDSQDLRHTLKLDAHQQTTHRFSLSDPSNRVLVQLPNDEFNLDDHYTFAPDDQKSTRVLVVDGDPSPKRQNSESYFFEHALNLHQKENQAIQVETISANGLKNRDLAQYDVVCLLNVATPPSESLNELLNDAKGLLIAMGDRIDFDSWNPVFAELGLELYENKRFPAPQPIDIRVGDHPIFASLSPADLDLYAQGVGINAFKLLSVGRSSFSIPLSLADGSPILLASERNQRRFVIWTSTLDLAWTNFALQPGYLPIVRQMLDYLTFKESQTQSVQLTVSEAMVSGLIDKLVLKQAQAGFRDLVVNGPLPGIYSHKESSEQHLVHLVIDSDELDFRPLRQNHDEGSSSAMEELGFKEFARLDLAPNLIWWLFIIVLVETLIAGRMSLLWGAR